MFIFQFLNDKVHNYIKQNIIENFIIQKLTEREETKTTNFAPVFQVLDDKIHNYVKNKTETAVQSQDDKKTDMADRV